MFAKNLFLSHFHFFLCFVFCYKTVFIVLVPSLSHTWYIGIVVNVNIYCGCNGLNSKQIPCNNTLGQFLVLGQRFCLLMCASFSSPLLPFSFSFSSLLETSHHFLMISSHINTFWLKISWIYILVA